MIQNFTATTGLHIDEFSITMGPVSFPWTSIALIGHRQVEGEWILEIVNVKDHKITLKYDDMLKCQQAHQEVLNARVRINGIEILDDRFYF